jgi:hypothetical protein
MADLNARDKAFAERLIEIEAENAELQKKYYKMSIEDGHTTKMMRNPQAVDDMANNLSRMFEQEMFMKLQKLGAITLEKAANLCDAMHPNSCLQNDDAAGQTE